MAGPREKLLTASDLAALCEVDLKTIHNWVARGRIAHFRTPGRHLRFRPGDVAEFLRTWGYGVPRELAQGGSRTVLVVGSEEAMAHVISAVGNRLSPPDAPANGPEPIRRAADPYDALILAGSEPADAYVVDLGEVEPRIEVKGMLEALHRASPHAALVLLAEDRFDEGSLRIEIDDLPAFVSRVRPGDDQALRASLLAEEPVASPEDLASEEAAPVRVAC